MSYHVQFFAKRGEVAASDALDQLIAAVSESGGPVLVRERGEEPGASWCDLFDKKTMTSPLIIELWTGARELAEEILELTPDGDTHGIRGSDLMVSVQLLREADWSLMRRVWDVLVRQWGAVPYDSISEFSLTF
ncbi:hypothetical protein [Actinomadura litoris]|uniref:Uncharacterized protein n=1 Tax=Actinomadura litoris TaxID=2678616 RepID=A0A7K1L9E2_9ACTN|nr:hypothetical protein [Actinomadura litoris]MUN41041.1 hypothetical protein [Actinomadura litoris]